jgi:hypothetical protein
MRIAIMQPYLLPYLGYYQLIAAVDKFVILDDVHFINKGWINRNRILVNGKSTFFTVPLEKASQNRLIKDICILPATSWKIKFLKTIELAYRKAPYFELVYPMVQKIMEHDESVISKFIYQSLLHITAYLEITTEIIASSVIYQNSDLAAQDKIIDICFQEKATQYINPLGGIELYDDDKFKTVGIQLHFLKSHLPVYRQYNAEFVPALSIIDVLMFNSKATVQNFIGAYEFVPN